MLKELLLLTSALFINNAYSQIDSNLFGINDTYSKVNFNFSGYVTGTYFSDNKWQNNFHKAALNVAVDIVDDWGIQTQIMNDGNSTRLSRFTIEKYFNIEGYNEGSVKIGTFPRLDYIFNGSVDIASNAMLALLPFGQYNHRLLDSNTYTKLTGININLSSLVDFHYINAHFDYGRSLIDDNCHIYNEAARQPCIGKIRYLPKNKNYSLGLKIEKGEWLMLLNTNRISIKSDPDYSDDPNTRLYTILYNNNYIYSTTIGVRYKIDDWWFQTEIKKKKYVLEPYKKYSDKETLSVNARSSYFLVGYVINDDLSAHVSYSLGSDTLNRNANNAVIGINYTYKNATLSVEYHKGRGREWMNYFTPTDRWQSIVATATYSF